MAEKAIMKNKILISVIVPLYNKAPWVEQCTQSIIDQTYQNIEILIINDGSTDNSREVFAVIDDKRIKIFDKSNAGVSSARNLGIEKARGEYIAFIDADDAWKPRHLEVMLSGFDRFDDVVLVCDDLVELAEGEKEQDKKRNLPFYLTKRNDDDIHYFLLEDYLRTLKDNFFILSGSSVLIKASVIKEHQLRFYEQITHGEDVNYWLQLNLFGKFVFCDYIGLHYHRVDEKSAMSQKVQKPQLTPGYFYGLDMNDYNDQEKDTIKKFLTHEYYKKAYQNRGLPLKKEELLTQVGGGVQVGKLNVIPYLVIRYCPQVIFDFYKKLKTR